MRPTTSSEIRQAFLDYFSEVQHQIVPSAPLPQHDNPTLLFTNAGMNQFADVFLGKEKRPYSRAVTAQKCMRVQGKHNDLENVGPSPRHHTYFEMLGNFSFGDYFKREAIDYAWQFLTGVMALDPKRLWATVYLDDDEAFALWQRYLPEARIRRFGKKDNYWEMGDTGPNGPCSEIHYYRGDLDNIDESLLNNDDDAGEQFLEIWNLVFMQYETDAAGNTTPLPKPSIDTGMGLERLARIVQEGDSNYETDLFLPAMDRVQTLLGDSDAQRQEKTVGYRVIADHGRAATFMIADGVRPGSTGAGYVLRMVIRRAARFGRKIGFQEPFLAQVADVYIDQMSAAYPELKARRDLIVHTLTQEEKRFARTLDAGLAQLDQVVAELKQQGETAVPGDVAFDLYATHGLPLEITRDVVQEVGLTVDEPGFKAAREAHALASGAGAFGEYVQDTGVYGRLLTQLQQSGRLEGGVEYDPYIGAQIESEIIGLIRDGEIVETVQAGDEAEVVTAATVFYVESGGEVSDTGVITAPGGVFRVADTRKPINGLVVHAGKVTEGRLAVGQLAALQVDDTRRSDIRRNHTATHILHEELRRHLGAHVAQAGSLVAPDRLRFDFTHDRAVDKETLAEIEAAVNQAIMANYPVRAEYMQQKEAIAAGAMALFGEKYGDIVRTIQIGSGGKRPYSFELCGGLHVSETNDIGLFHFTGEGAVSAGVRRVEAVTGRAAQQLVTERLDLLDRLAARLNAPVNDLEQRVEQIQAENRALHKQIEQAQRRLAALQFDAVMLQTRQINGARVLAARIDGVEVDGLRELADRFRDRVGSGVAVLATVKEEKPVMIAAVTPDLIPKGVKAGDIVREVAKIVGGGGGGRPDLAQAGGRDANKLSEALDAVAGLVESALGQK